MLFSAGTRFKENGKPPVCKITTEINRSRAQRLERIFVTPAAFADFIRVKTWQVF